MNPLFLSRGELPQLIRRLREEFLVVAPFTRGGRRSYRTIDAAADEVPNLGEVRSVEPLKAFYLKARERVAEGFTDSIPAAAERPVCILGVKACDLKGLEVQDRVFLGDDVQDPSYRLRRERNLIVSSDCTCAIDTCFCTALHGAPYPREGFDLNFSEVDGGFVVDAGSPKGERLVERHRSLLRGEAAAELAARERARARVRDEVRAAARAHEVPDQDALAGAVQRAYESPIWKEEGARCVECGACNTICPTCHCFLLADQAAGERLARLRLWDSCLIKDFARVAGGANPRPWLWMRLRNRFEKKFDFFPKTGGLYACTGCGRCISACPARIDIRKVLKGVSEYERQQQPVSAS
jgi:sulfhydrogenase subunit beta (sulfur reductase)